MTHWYDIIPLSPFVRPAWRWELASWIVRTGKRVPAQYTDEWVARATRYLTAPPTSKRHDAIREAHALHVNQASPKTALLDALVLTGASRSVIARRCDLRQRVVEAYESLFLDVRERLHQRDWIARSVIGGGLWGGFTRDDMGSLWRAFGCFAGIHILDVIVAVSIQEGLVKDAGALRQHIPTVTDTRLIQSARMAITATMLPSITSGMKLNHLHTQVREVQVVPKTRSVGSIVADSAMQILTSVASDMQLAQVDRTASVA